LVRGAAALLVLVAVGLVGFTSPAAARAKAELSVVTSEGFGRLVILFDEDVEAKVRSANGIVVVSFDRPVDIAVDRLSSQAPGYVAAARRDPDGKGVRIALASKLRVNSLTAGERLYVDLLPDTWTGAPPGLPQEVVEDLARRAREAEKKVRQQQQIARQRQMPLTRVRVSNQPTFSRYVFDLPDLIPVATAREKDSMTVTFDAPLKFDLADAKGAPPPMMAGIETEIRDNTTIVRFAFIGNVDVRTFREDASFVVDVGAVEAGKRRAESDPTGLAALLAEGRDRRRPAPPSVDPPQTVPAPGPATPAPAAAAAAQVTPQTAPVPPAARPAPAPAPAPAPLAAPVTPPPPVAPAPAPAVAPAPASAPPPPQPAVAAAPPVMPPPDAPAAAVSPAAPPLAAPVPAPAPAAAEPLRAAGATPLVPADPTGAVTVEVTRQSDTLSLGFPFAVETPVAVFMRADSLWAVFDTRARLDIGAINRDRSGAVRTATVMPLRDGQALRLKLERPRLATVRIEGSIVTILIGDQVMEPPRPLGVVRNPPSQSRATAAVPFGDPRTIHRLTDPEAGDELVVVTGLGPPRGFLQGQDFVEFSALPSAHGVVVQPLADDLTVELGTDRVTIGRPGGLAVSSSDAAGRRSGLFRPAVFDPQLWGFDREANFEERRRSLIDGAAEALETRRTGARMDLARFYLAREMYPEAKGVLDVAIGDEKPGADDPAGLLMRALASIMLGRVPDALKDLSHPVVVGHPDAQIWRGMAMARQGNWADAYDKFRNAEASVAPLPIQLQRMILKEAVRAGIEVKDFAGAARTLHAFETLGIDKDMEGAIAVLAGQVAEGLGRSGDALTDYRLAVASGSGPAAAQGRLRETVLRYHLGDLKRSEVIADLEELTTIWRGDETETEALQLLARLYTQEARYRDAFHVMRTALMAHPNSDHTRRIQEEAAATFDTLFLAGKGDAMPAVDALGLFYDFRELTPIGRRGDEMIRRLADRLVSVDLLDQAAELLQHQVDHRLQGAGRAQVATRLAIVYLMNRKPDRALATLRSTQSTNLATELRNQRLLIEGRALSDIGRPDLALEVIGNLEGREAIRLRSDILWGAKRWQQAAEQIELMYGDRWRDWQPLSEPERDDLLRAAVGYAIAGDAIGLGRFREKYVAKMADGPTRRAFDVATAPSPTNTGEFAGIARMVAATDTLDSFLRDMRMRYPETGSFSHDVPLPPGNQTRAPLADPIPTAALRPRPATAKATR
jgi:tetratricopeptide (TPR) repeat protein